MQQEITGVPPAQQLRDKTIQTNIVMPATIQLNFINQSNDVNNSDIVIFQKNVIPGNNEFVTAWKVIRNCGQGWNHPIVYSLDTTVSVNDSDGNFSPHLPAKAGDAFQLTRDHSGDKLMRCGNSPAVNAIEVRNNLSEGTMNAFVYRSGSIAARKTNIMPGQVALFEFRPTIFIGVASQVTEGEYIRSAIVSRINTEISLLGFSSADIVMTGGGSGPNATPYQFSLQNIEMM